MKEKFPTEKRFLSLLNLVPNNKIIYSKVKRKKNKAGQSFREAANGLWNSKSPLREYLRKKKAKSGGNRAIVATARKTASIYYKIVTEQVPFDQDILATKTKENLIRKIVYLEKICNHLPNSLLGKVLYNRCNVQGGACLLIPGDI